MNISSEKKRYGIDYKIVLNEDLGAFLNTLRKISNITIDDLLYENEIWDGPLTGLCLWNGEKYYFHSIEQYNKEYNLEKIPRPYFLIKLTDEQLINEELLHADTVRYIESHPYVRKGHVSTRPAAEWDKYYEACEKYPDQEVKQDQIVGWFEW